MQGAGIMEPIDGIECKWSANDFDPRNLLSFHRQYPQASSTYVVAADVDRTFRHGYKGMAVCFVGLQEPIGCLQSPE